MNGNKLRVAEQYSHIFGMEFCQKILGDKWNFKIESLNNLEERLMGKLDVETLLAMLGLLVSLLDDRNP